MTDVVGNDRSGAGRILLTGGSGLIGRKLVRRLIADGFDLVLAQRTPPLELANIKFVKIDDIGPATDWRDALAGCQTVIHLAGQVPQKGVPAEVMTRVNDLGTGQLALQSRDTGVARLIYLSSVLAVSGNSADYVVDSTTMPRPNSIYGVSKRAGEQHVSDFSGRGRAAVSLRPPLVYHAGAKGNWGMLLQLAAKAIPLPFAAVRNRRSLISLENLVDAIAQVAGCESPESGQYGVAETHPVSLPEIIASLRQGMKRPPGLFSVPPKILSGLLQVSGRSSMAEGLLGNLELSSALFQERFRWVPKQETMEGLRACGAAFASDCHNGGGARN